MATYWLKILKVGTGDEERQVVCESGSGYSVHSSNDDNASDSDAYVGNWVPTSHGWTRCSREEAEAAVGFDLEPVESEESENQDLEGAPND